MRATTALTAGAPGAAAAATHNDDSPSSTPDSPSTSTSSFKQRQLLPTNRATIASSEPLYISADSSTESSPSPSNPSNIERLGSAPAEGQDLAREQLEVHQRETDDRGHAPVHVGPGRDFDRSPVAETSRYDEDDLDLDLDLDEIRAVGEEEANRRHHPQQQDHGVPWRSDADEAADMASRAPQAAVRGSTETMRMILLTFSAIGITFTWGVEMAYCTPYLLKLGLTKSNTSLVWIAGPLSGLIVQPLIGAISDESTSRWGRRRPLMMLGVMIVAVCLVVLGFTREMVGLFENDDEKAKRPTIFLAVFAIYAVDFAINVAMSCGRSLMVDTLPIEKQQSGAAWFSRMSAVGHLMSYVAGAVDLVELFGTTMGDTQFKQLTMIAVFIIVSTNALTCWAVTEKVYHAPPRKAAEGRFQILRQIYSTVLHLPPRIQAICWAQFWSWIGWFPFLFYSTTWVGETYFRYDAPRDGKTSDDALGDVGRIGSTALVIYSSITFVGAFVLPLLIESPDDKSYTLRPPPALAGFLERLHKMKPDLLTAWIAGHITFACAMALAPFATSFRFATVLVSICGIPWTIAGWAPVSFLGVEVNKLSGGVEGGAHYSRLPDPTQDTELSVLGSPRDASRFDDDREGATAPSAELSGIYFGILNIYTTLPQFIGTFISTIVFAILEPGKSPELADKKPDETDTSGPNAISVCLFIGAISTLYAAVATRKLKYL